MDKSNSFQKCNSKGEKFRPNKIPRYLPGSLQGAVITSDLKEYNKHLYKVFTATPKVDDLPPKFHFDKYMGTSNLEGALAALRNVEKSNKILLQKINTINRTKGKIDTFNEYANNHSSKWDVKLQEFEKINTANKKFFNTLMNTASTYPKSEYDKQWQLTMHKMGYFAKYPLVVFQKQTKDQMLRQCPSISKNLEITETEPITRPRCFLEFKIDNGIVIGKVIVELYSDQVPNTVEHFLKQCCAKRKKSLKNCPVSKIVINKYCIAGDPTNYNGKGEVLEQENFNLQHTRPGVLSMISTGENEVSSQFCITFTEMTDFDEKNVVFGKIVRGGLILFKLCEFGSWHGKPITKIIISDCGVWEEEKRSKLTSKMKGH